MNSVSYGAFVAQYEDVLTFNSILWIPTTPLLSMLTMGPPLFPFNSILWIRTRLRTATMVCGSRAPFNSILWIPRGDPGEGSSPDGHCTFNSILWIHKVVKAREARATTVAHLSIPFYGFVDKTFREASDIDVLTFNSILWIRYR